MAFASDRKANYYCEGDILALLFADQIHDFLGSDRGIKKIKESKKNIPKDKQETLREYDERMKRYIKSAWGDIEVKKDNETMKITDILSKLKGSPQSKAEQLIEEYSGKDGDLDLGKLEKFKVIKKNSKPSQIEVLEDIGYGTRKYIQYRCKDIGIDIEKGKNYADVKIDYLASNKAFLTAMINPQITKGSCPLITPNFHKQIVFSPILSNVYDQAATNSIYSSSTSYYSEKQRNKSINERYSIVDTNKNKLEWGLIDSPKFCEIAKWYKNPTPSQSVDNFMKKFGLNKENKEDLRFLYNIMIEGFSKFLNISVDLQNGNKFILKNYLTSHSPPYTMDKKTKENLNQEYPSISFGVLRPIGKGSTQNYTAASSKVNKYYWDKEGGEQWFIVQSYLILEILENLGKDLSPLYCTGQISVTFKQLLESFSFFAFVSELKIKDIDYSENLKKSQSAIMEMGGPSVLNISQYLKDNVAFPYLESKLVLTCLFLKTLGDLSIVTGAFFGGVVNALRNVNFFSTGDKTAAQIASTLKYMNMEPPEGGGASKDSYLWPYILREIEGRGMSGYNAKAIVLEGDLLLEDILELSGYSIIETKNKEQLNTFENNCNMFRNQYIDNIEDEELVDKLQQLSCENSEIANWNILEEAKNPKLEIGFIRDKKGNVLKARRIKKQNILERIKLFKEKPGQLSAKETYNINKGRKKKDGMKNYKKDGMKNKKELEKSWVDWLTGGWKA